VNLKEIREEINSALDYNPDLKQYDDNLTRVINRHYLQVSSQYQWLFMQKRYEFMIRADIDGSSTDTLTGDGTRKVVLPTTTGAGIKNLPSDIEGKTLVINNVKYTITRYVDARTFIIDQPLDSGTYTSWKIQYVIYPMPKDSIEVLGIMDRGIVTNETVTYSSDTTSSTLTAPNRGRFMFLDARKEENLYLDRADTGDPFVSIEEMPPAIVRPPDYAPVLFDFEHGDGLLIAGQTYEYCYTFLYAGQESSPSPVSSVTLPTSGKKYRVVLDKLIDTSAHRSSGSTDTGRLKKIYRRLVNPLVDPKLIVATRLDSGVGNWRHIATVKEDTGKYVDEGKELTTATVVGSDGTLSDTVDPTGDLFDLALLDESGPRQYLRLWYTPKSDYMVEARYHKRPFRLVNDSDSPDWPVQYHHYLVYSALKDIAMQHGMATYSQLYEARAKDLLERMKSKYLSRSDRMYVRRGFDRAMADRERFGIPSKS
jgi:hypothetical protein|tara:strand:+ start:752 stop:2197 length:1446 start_codon:yes stop_codon:yes gene_type:complete